MDSTTSEILTYEGSFFFLEHRKFNLVPKNGKKVRKTFMVFQVISFQLVSVSFVKYFGNTRSSQSTWYQTDEKS